MADREDIDALLIGALYGELGEADRARLDAHLASHPQDRHSLEAMRSTRGLLRDAEVATAMVEPPAAVSALLLQEAARRAPAARRGENAGGLLGFLAGFLRPVMAHPALSAAAMLVVVAGTAGVLYMRGSAKVVQPEGANEPALAGAPAAATAPDQGARDQDFAFERDDGQGGEGALEGNVALDRGAALDPATIDSYRVSLEESKNQAALAKREAQGQLAFTPTPTKDAAKGKERTGEARPGYVAIDGEREVPAVRDVGDDAVAGEVVADGRVATKPAKIAQSPTPAPPPPAAPSSPAPGSAFAGTAAGSGSAAGADLARGLAPTNSLLADKPTAPIAAGAATGTTRPADPKMVRPYNARSDAATIEWAKAQHARMIKLNEAGKCNEFGLLGAEINRRAPDYYAEHVFNDRRIRGCRPYVDKARRAAEPARKRDLPSPAAAEEALAPDKAAN